MLYGLAGNMSLEDLFNDVKEAVETKSDVKTDLRTLDLVNDEPNCLKKYTDDMLIKLYNVCKRFDFLAEMSDDYNVTISEQEMIPSDKVLREIIARGITDKLDNVD